MQMVFRFLNIILVQTLYSLKKTLSGNKNNKFTDTNLGVLTSNSYKVRSYLNVQWEKLIMVHIILLLHD